MSDRHVRDIVGSSHVAGRYCLTDKDYLNEGADQLLTLGSHVIKLWFTPRPQSDYPFNSEWPKIDSLVDLAKTRYYRDVFAKPFTTYLLEAFPPGDSEHDWQKGLSAEGAAWHKERFYEVAKHFLTEYRGTGKTFILQNWESDWMLTDPQFTKEPTPELIQGMIDWLNARQDGVEQARQEIGMDGVTVANAAEVNLIARAMEGKVSATNDVMPHTHCDLYSYSAYDTSIFLPDQFRDALDYLAEKTPASKLFGERNVMVGEFGAPENEFDQYGILKRTVEVSLDWGAQYVVYWQVYCNEPGKDFDGTATNANMRGFWLIRPDGTRAPAWDYFAEVLG